MVKYVAFVLLFLATITMFFVGLFANIRPLVFLGAILLVALFFTRRYFIAIQEP